jgi:hypothetical protein
VAQPAQGAEHRLPLGIGDLWLQDDVDDHHWHGDEGTGTAVGPLRSTVGAGSRRVGRVPMEGRRWRRRTPRGPTRGGSA